MAATEGRLDCVSVVDVSYCDNGKSLRLELRASIPPYETIAITLRNAFNVRLSQSPDDGYPFFVPEVRWRAMTKAENEQMLNEALYAFFDEHGHPLVSNRQLLVLELEGAICGQVVAESIECTNN
ncbi:MAG: hypothetical protein ACYC3X_31960 [Pirellulaceae bacterium]